MLPVLSGLVKWEYGAFMKFLPLIFKNLLRNRRRSLLTLISIAVSLFLVSILQAVLTELQDPAQAPDSALRLITRHKVSLYSLLPLAHRQKILKVDGVEAAIGWMWFGGLYKDYSNFFPNIAVDTDQFFQVHSDMVLPEEQRAGFLKDQAGALVGISLVKRFGWKIGDQVHLKGTLFKIDPDFTIRAIYSSGVDDGGGFFFHFSYFNESLKKLGFGAIADHTSTFTVRARSIDEVPKVAEKIDRLFKETSFPTSTETEKTFLLTFLSTFGNVKFLVNSICGVVIFAIILVAANSMALSIRERWREIGVMKTLGFRERQVLALLITESMLLAGGGSASGALLGMLLMANLNMSRLTAGFIQRLPVTMGNGVGCLVTGLTVGLLAAGIPSWRASRRSAVEAIRRVA